MNDDLIDDLSKLGNGENIIAVVVFGSVAREDVDEESDVDVCIILENLDRQFKETIGNKILDLEKKHNKNIQVIFTDRDMSGVERYLVESILSEGKILEGKLPPIPIQTLELEPYVIIRYDLSNLNQAGKMHVRRELFGQETKKNYKGKRYISCKKGLVEKNGGERIGIASLMVKTHVASEIEKFLARSGAKVRKFRIWASKV